MFESLVVVATFRTADADFVGHVVVSAFRTSDTDSVLLDRSFERTLFTCFG